MTYYVQTALKKNEIHNNPVASNRKPDFCRATTLAYEELIIHDCSSFPINIEQFFYDGNPIQSMSFQEYADRSGTTLMDITINNKYNEGLALVGLRPELKLVLYNSDTEASRQKHTYYHEIGHIKLGHTQHGDVEEVEAHFFAAQILMPNVVLKEMISRGVNIDKQYLTKTFGVSGEAADKKLEYLSKYPSIYMHQNEYDEMILDLCADYLNLVCPNDRVYDWGC